MKKWMTIIICMVLSGCCGMDDTMGTVGKITESVWISVTFYEFLPHCRFFTHWDIKISITFRQCLF